MKPSRRIVLLSLLAARCAPAAAAISAFEAARIERLLKYVEVQRDVSFVRNGNAYSSKDAAQFLRAKYARMGGQVGSAEQFIEHIAARSSTSGEAYLMRLPDGRTLPAAQVLAEELRRIDRQP